MDGIAAPGHVSAGRLFASGAAGTRGQIPTAQRIASEDVTSEPLYDQLLDARYAQKHAKIA